MTPAKPVALSLGTFRLQPSRSAVVSGIGTARLLLGLNPLLLTDGAKPTLVDAGPGVLDSRVVPDALAVALAAHGLQRTDLRRVLLTHLHRDHAGGLVEPDGTGGWRSTLAPDAEIVVQRTEWAHALDQPQPGPTDPPDLFSYPPVAALLALEPHLTLLDGDTDLGGGIRAHLTGGHTPGHQAFGLDGERLLLPGDLLATAYAVRFPDAGARDEDPPAARAARLGLIERARRDGLRLLHYHAPRSPWGTVEPVERHV